MQDSQRPISADVVFRKSWVAYLGPTIAFVIALGMGVAMCLDTAWQGGVPLMLISAAAYGYVVAERRSVALFVDAHGVWVYRGILPWNRGTMGVKWRDLEDAVYVTGFWSWLLRSWTVRVGHRFTKTSEILLEHMANGKEAAAYINQRHRDTLQVMTPDERAA